MVNVKVLCACLLFASSSAFAVTDCSIRLSGRSVATGSSICLNTTTYPTASHVQSAAGNWNSNCAVGETTPWLNVGGCTGSPIVINVAYQAGISTNVNRTCGIFQGTTSGGALTGGTITIYQYGMWMTGSEAGTTYLCSAQAVDTITHELGHVLGLDNATQDACAGHIMGRRLFGDRDIFSDDCSEVNRLWTTAAEQQAQCELKCWTDCENGVCPPVPVTQLPNPCPYSPILIDVDGNGFHLAGIGDAVSFDLNADGQPDQISWTAFGAGDAFLVFDRNGNGTIDDGSELFGNFTPLLSGGVAPNGYEALTEFDDAAFGGNGDSVVTAADLLWGHLQIWTDRNHDGISNAGELASLSSTGITEFDTNYKRSNKTDSHGNLFRFRSKVKIDNENGHSRSATTYDVFFVKK